MTEPVCAKCGDSPTAGDLRGCLVLFEMPDGADAWLHTNECSGRTPQFGVDRDVRARARRAPADADAEQRRARVRAWKDARARERRSHSGSEPYRKAARRRPVEVPPEDRVAPLPDADD